MPVNIQITPTALDDPLYYLRNLQTVIRWVLEHHHDLLIDEEIASLNQLLSLPEASQALLARMVMRKGEYFRSDALGYQEIACIEAALTDLLYGEFLANKPLLTAAEIFRLCRVAELRSLLSARGNSLPASFKKSDGLAFLQAIEHRDGPLPLSVWWPQAEFSVFALCCQPLFDRLRAMFFGNLYQDWSEFVLTELGHQRYEPVRFLPSSRAFSCREDVDTYLALAASQQILEESGDGRLALASLPPLSDNEWLAYRRDKVLYQIAQHEERHGDVDLALSLYRSNAREEAMVRALRLLEKTESPAQMLIEVEAAIQRSQQPLTHLHLQRIFHRAARKTQQKELIEKRAFTMPTSSVEIQALPEQRVERLAADYLQSRNTVEVFYTENALFPGLLALLCWPVLFEALPGAFFNPFQSGPADLFRPDFVRRRKAALAARLARLDDGSYQQEIRSTWQEKYGTACSLVQWSVLSEDLLDIALNIIPAAHLKQIFTHLLADLRHHRSGLPDLSAFNRKQGSYELIEIKGPGDRLQDHQTLWLENLANMGVPVSVMHVRYGAPA